MMRNEKIWTIVSLISAIALIFLIYHSATTYKPTIQVCTDRDDGQNYYRDCVTKNLIETDK